MKVFLLGKMPHFGPFHSLKSNLCQKMGFCWLAETEACLEGQFECPFSVASTAPRSYFHSFLMEDLLAVPFSGWILKKNVLLLYCIELSYYLVLCLTMQC